MFHNKSIRYEGREYEIFWTTQNAHHVCTNFKHGTLHDIHHIDISQLLEHYDAAFSMGKDRYVFLNWQNTRNCVYEFHLYLVTGSRNRPGRCVVSTAYRTNKQQYIAFAAKHRQVAL